MNQISNSDSTEAKTAHGAELGGLPCSIFEMVDATDCEAYYTMGLFATLAEAIKYATDERHGEPLTEINDDLVIFEIKERLTGFTGYSVTGKLRATVTWKKKYSEEDEDDDGKWSFDISNVRRQESPGDTGSTGENK